MRRAALRSALSVKANNGDIVVLDEVSFDTPKTKQMVGLVKRLVDGRSTLVLLAAGDENIERAARNISDVKALRASYLNIRDLLGHDKILLPLDALDQINGFLGAPVEVDASEAVEQGE